MKKISPLFALLVAIIIAFSGGCGDSSDTRYDPNDSVPKGDPSFPPLTTSWVIDKANVLSEETVTWGDAIFEQLKQDGIAEVVLLVQKGVNHPEDYATHYGRWLKLGKKGPSTEGGNNGLVWLIRPDAPEKITPSVGRGLPKFTSNDYGQIMEQAKDYVNFHNYDRGVRVIIEQTNKRLREIYPTKRKEKSHE